MRPKTVTATPMCSCGCSERHVIAKRSTADGIDVRIWHDGAVTGRLGALPGVTIVRPRTLEAIERARRAAWLLAGEVETYDLSELPRLYTCARRLAAKGGGSPGELRAAFAAEDAPAIHFAWETYQTDRDGKAVVRVARLDRIRWPGLAVWHEAGTYTLLAIVRCGIPGILRAEEEVLGANGLTFATQRDLCRHLRQLSAPRYSDAP